MPFLDLFRSILALAAAASIATTVRANDELAPNLLDEITVVGAAGGMENVAGSISLLSADDLEVQAQSDILRILRAVPGVNLVEEDGYGLRPNIGFRGSGTDRSARIALMEDSVPIAPAPYAAPAAYYFPSAGRMSSIEVTKGPAVIKYGPRTTGGALNLFSTPIPDDTFSAYVEGLFGDFDRERVHAWAGGRQSVGGGFSVGGLAEVFKDNSQGFKEIDSGGSSGFDADDVVAKVGLYYEGGRRDWSLEFKYQTRDENADISYLGLTQVDFNATPFRRYASSGLDNFQNENELFQITLKTEITDNINLTATAYSNDVSRNWYKIEGVSDQGLGSDRTDFVSISSILTDPTLFQAEIDLLTGAASLDDSLVLRNNKRAYDSRGIQIVTNGEFEFGRTAHDISVGMRIHKDEEDRFQDEDAYRLENDNLILTTDGLPGSQSNRISTADAFAVFAQDRVSIGNLQVTGGLRYENFEIIRNDFSTSDPSRAGGPTRVRENKNHIFLPAISTLYNFENGLTLLAGVHRGFAIASPGNANADPEEAINYEIGGRFAQNSLSVEAIGFFNDYSNLLGTCTGSTGCSTGAIGDQFNGGDVDVYGLEFTAAWDVADVVDVNIGPFGDLSVPISLTYTFTKAEFRSDFQSDFDPFGSVNAGDELPYVPTNQVTLTAGVDTSRIGFNIAANYVSEARAFSGTGAIPIDEVIDSRWVMDVAAYIVLTDNFRLKAKVENLLDEVYVAARRPAGARPGKPLEALIGFEATF